MSMPNIPFGRNDWEEVTKMFKAKNIKQNRIKVNLSLIISFIGLFLSILVFLGFDWLYFNNIFSNSKRSSNCEFSLIDIQEFRGDYGENRDHYFIYEGLIRNNSGKKHFLKAMIVNIYNENNVLIASGYTSMNAWVNSNISIPFKIHSMDGYGISSEKRKVFDESKSFRADVYPWFSTCK